MLINLIKKTKENVVYFIKIYLLKVNKIMPPAYMLSEVLKRDRAIERSYYFFYTGLIDHACRVIEKELKSSEKISDLIMHHYFQCLLLSSPRYLSHKSYLKKIIRITTKKKLFNSNPPEIKRKNEESKKILKVGYICHFFSSNISQNTVCNWINLHDPSKVDAYALSDDSKVGATPNNIDLWNSFRNQKNFIDTSKMTSSEYIEFIRRSKFDILIELNGHCEHSRFAELSNKISPIQAIFHNISGPSGVRAIDYIMYQGSAVNVAPIKNYYTERMIRIESDATSINLGNYYPDICESAFKKNKFITFGSFGAIHKVHIEHFKLWCEILKNVPNSHFFFKASALDDKDIRAAWEMHFFNNGIDLSRVRFEGYEPHFSMLKKYAEVDIALDTFPHGAGTTTIDALYMGVPVIALNGERLCSQHGRLIIGDRFECPELIANNENEYVEKAVYLANNPSLIAKYRKNLRKNFLNSPNSDIGNFVTALESAYEKMWKSYIENGN